MTLLSRKKKQKTKAHFFSTKSYLNVTNAEWCFQQQNVCESTPTQVFHQLVSADHTELSNNQSVIYICILLDTPLIAIDQSVYCFSQSINSPRPVFLTERKPTWAKPAHPDNIDKLGSERMNWLDLCSSQLDYQPLYIFLRIVTHMYHIYIKIEFKLLLLWARSFSTGRYFLGQHIFLVFLVHSSPHRRGFIGPRQAARAPRCRTGWCAEKRATPAAGTRPQVEPERQRPGPEVRCPA